MASSFRFVGRAYLEESLEKKREHVVFHATGVLVMRADWTGRFDDLQDIYTASYPARTRSVSTIALIDKTRI